MSVILKQIVAIAVSATVPSVAFAHAGHHNPADGRGLLHALTQPDHLVAVLLVGAVVVAAAKGVGVVAARIRRRRIGSLVVQQYRDVR